jgi:hypothetical protein
MVDDDKPGAEHQGLSLRSSVTPAQEQPKSPDVVVLGPPTADGGGVHVLRAREQRLEAGELRSIEEGRPITGEIVTLAPRTDNPRVCDVKDSYLPPRHAPVPQKAKGPAQVATKAYRENWDEVFARRPRGALN